VVVFRKDGSVKCRHESRGWAGNNDNGVYSTPALGDVDGDGFRDIVFGGWDLYVHALDRNCNELPGFPVNVEDSTWSSPALYDSDGDGRLEIFIGSDQMAGGAIDWSGGEFRALDWRNGTVVELWKRRIDDVFHSSPAIGDIDGDGSMEVVTGGGNYYNRGDGRKVFAFNIHDGSDQGGFPVVTGAQTNSSPAIGDVNNDGVADVVVGSHDGYVRAINGHGGLIWQNGLRFLSSTPGGPVANPIIADLNGDGVNDVGVGNNFAFFLLNGSNGAEMAAVNTFLSYESAGAVGDFGSLGWKLIVSGFDTPNNATRIESYAIPTPGKTPPWPMFHKQALHLGADPSGGDPLPPGYCERPSNPAAAPSGASSRGYWLLGLDGGLFSFGDAPFFGSANGKLFPGETAIGLQATPTGNGYYIVTDRGRVFTFGDAVSHGSMEGLPLNAPIIAIAPTPGGNGYWLLGRDGGVFSFGDARFWGSMGGVRLNQPVISMAPTTTGRGYWLLASDGGVFSFGDAAFKGSTGAMLLAAPVISMATAPNGGYWLVALDGGVFSFGVDFYGSLPGTGLCFKPVGIQIRPSKTGRGYYVVALDGAIFAFGDALFHGSYPGLPFDRRVVDMAVR
jgi:hypothetical protein